MTIKSKALIVESVILCVLLCLVTPLNAAIPRLHVEGNKIKDPNGDVVVLRGVALIDLGSAELYEGGAINMINRLTNKTDAEGNSPGWYTKIVRIPIFPMDSLVQSPFPFDPNDANNSFYNNLLRPVIDYCAQKDVYAVIDWHYNANTYDHVATTSQFWAYMAPRFKNDSHVIFELFCEPINTVGSDTDNWLSVRNDMQTWINIVRTYAPDNLIIVSTPRYCQIIGPTAAYPVDGNNIVYASHIYPYHWYSDNQYYRNSITAAAAAHPVIMAEWGFSQSSLYSGGALQGTITDYGQPLMDFDEGLKIGTIAWVASYDWEPSIFWTDWTLRCGEGEMGCFMKDKLYEKRNDDQPMYGFVDFTDFANFALKWRRDDCSAENAWCDGADFNHDLFVQIDDLQQFVSSWLYGSRQ